MRNGGGLFAAHGSARLCSLEPEAEHNRLLGGYVDRRALHGHPTNHAAPFPVRLPDPDHPLVCAFRSADRRDELTHRTLVREGAFRKPYRVRFTAPKELCDELCVLLPAANHEHRPRVLVEVDRSKTVAEYPAQADDFTYAVAWIKRYGKGRVFLTQLGQSLAVYSVACVAKAMLDGLQYAACDLVVDIARRQAIGCEQR